MSNILFLTSQYMGAAGANGICTRNIVAELRRKGHAVSVLCYDDGSGNHVEDVYTISVQQTKSNYLAKMIAACKSFFCTMTDRKKEQLFTDMTISLCCKKNFDVVVCMFFPLETVSVLQEVKERFPKIKTVVYELDSVGDGIFAASKFHYFAKLAYERWMENNYRYADKIVIMKSHELYWKQVWGQTHGDKLMIADIPVLVPRKLPAVVKNDEKTRFLYGGLLDYDYRSPEKLIHAFCEIGNRMDWQVDFYSKGCDDLLSSVERENERFVRHGYVSSDVLELAIAHADVLISIGNKVSNSVPSKMISYMGYGKPIIHFSLQENDVCANYLQNYPLALMIDANEPAPVAAQKIHDFIRRNTGKTVFYDVVSKAMQWNTPEYSAGVILDLTQ